MVKVGSHRYGWFAAYHELTDSVTKITAHFVNGENRFVPYGIHGDLSVVPGQDSAGRQQILDAKIREVRAVHRKDRNTIVSRVKNNDFLIGYGHT